MPRLVALVLLACLVSATAHAQGKIPLGMGTGSYAGTAGPADVGDRIDFQHAVAYRVFEGEDRTKRFTAVLISDAPIPDAKAQDEAYLASEAKAGRLKALQIRLRNADGAVVQHAVFDARGRTPLDAPEKAKFTKTAFFFTRVEGQVHFYPQPENAVVVQRGYLVIFNARVRQGPWREPGEAIGTVRLGPRTFDLRHAAMVEEDKQTTVVLSGEPLDALDDRAAVAALAAEKGFAVLWTVVADDGKVVLSKCLGPGATEGEADAAAVDWQREDWRNGLMRGRLASEDAPAGAACVADVYFAAGR